MKISHREQLQNLHHLPYGMVGTWNAHGVNKQYVQNKQLENIMRISTGMNINVDVREICFEDVNWIEMTQKES
jgi:hypothetical protein